LSSNPELAPKFVLTTLGGMRSADRASRRVAAGCGLIVSGIGVLAFAGWVTGDVPLQAVYASRIVIKTNAAIALVCAGLSLYLLSAPQRSVVRDWIARGLATAATLIAGFTLFEHLTGWNPGFDTWLFTEATGALGTTSPNRMGPPASISIPLLGIALLMLDRLPARRVPFHQPLALTASVIASGPLLGYALGVQELFGIARYTGIALNTAVALWLLALGVLCARPEVGVVRRFLAADSGGLLLRRMIPVAVVLPVLLGRLRIAGETAGLYDQPFGRSVLILSFILLFSGVTWWTASAVQRMEAARLRAEAAERDLRDQLAASLDSERAARSQAERSNRLKDEFLATVSHELRTPLSAITGWVQLLIAGGLSESDQQRALNAIARNSRLQVNLVNDLLDMSRIESGKLRLELDDVDLVSVVEAVVAAAAPGAEAKGLTLEQQLPSAPLVVRGDVSRLQQIVGNLLSNATKFTPKGGRITVSMREADDVAEIVVADTGIGIEPAFIAHVFERFRQGDASTTRNHGGLGLGLAIAHQLTERHGGTLVAHSDGRGHGASFTVRLPNGATMSGGLVRAAAAPEEPRLDGLRVLIVDDEPDVCELAQRVLTGRGAEVVAAATVDAAIAALGQLSFDLLVSDIGMPGKDGYDLIRHVRAMHGSLPAIALTAFARTVDAERAEAEGFQRHLTKPVQPDELVRTVAALCMDTPNQAIA